MTWGAWGKALNTKGMTALMEAAMDLGIHTFDHADIYGGYTTERDFGMALAQSGMDRETITLISKCGIQMPCDERPLEVKHYDYSAKHIQMSVENSLKNLKSHKFLNTSTIPYLPFNFSANKFPCSSTSNCYARSSDPKD